MFPNASLRQPHPSRAQTRTALAEHVLRHAPFRQGLKLALEAFADNFNADRSLRSAANDSKVLDLPRNFRFWEQMETMSWLSRPVVIEIGIIERRSTNLSDVCAVFGRLYAYFKSLKEETAAVSLTGTTISPVFAVSADPSVTALTHQVSGSALGFLQWRLRKYNDTSLLVMVHILDPSRHLYGLRTSNSGVAERSNALHLFLAVAARFWAARAGPHGHRRR